MTELGFPRLVRQGWLSVHAAREAAQVSAGLWCSRPAWCRERADATSRSKGRPGERRRCAASQGCSTCGTTWGRESWRGDFNTSAVRRPGRIRARSLRAHATNRPAAVSSRPVLTSPVTSPRASTPYPTRRSRSPRTIDRAAAGGRTRSAVSKRLARRPRAACDRCNTNGLSVSEGGLELTRDPSAWTHPARFCDVLSTNRRVAVSSIPVLCGPVTSPPLANGLQL